MACESLAGRCRHSPKNQSERNNRYRFPNCQTDTTDKTVMVRGVCRCVSTGSNVHPDVESHCRKSLDGF